MSDIDGDVFHQTGSHLWDVDPADGTFDKTAFDVEAADKEKQDVVPMEEDERSELQGRTSDQIALVGKDGIEVWCSKSKAVQQSRKLSRMIADQHADGRIHLPLASNEAYLLAKGIEACETGWHGFQLEELIRAADIFHFYDLRRWGRFALETAILDRLQGSDQEHSALTFFRDPRFAAKLKYTAQQGSMDQLLSFIDEQGFSCGLQYEIEDDRPRKRRKCHQTDSPLSPQCSSIPH